MLRTKVAVLADLLMATAAFTPGASRKMLVKLLIRRDPFREQLVADIIRRTRATLALCS
jgi:hypothetical protein